MNLKWADEVDGHELAGGGMFLEREMDNMGMAPKMRKRQPM